MSNLKFKDKNGKWVGIPSIQGEPGPAGTPGPQGPAGKDGVDGRDGVTPTFEVGTVTTGEANVEMTGENNHYTLDFTFPEGISGGSTPRYIDLDALSSSNPLILENLELGVYALASSSSFASLYIKAKASNTKALKVDYATHGLRILNYHFPISEATNGRNVVMLSPSNEAPQYNRILTAYSSETSGLSTSRVSNLLIPDSYIGQFIPGLSSGKTNTYASNNVFNNLPTSGATPTEDNHLVNKKYVDNLVGGSNPGGAPTTQELINLFYPVGSYYETSDTSFNPNTSWGGTWELEEDGTVLVSKSNDENSKFNKEVGTKVGTETHFHNIYTTPAGYPIKWIEGVKRYMYDANKADDDLTFKYPDIGDENGLEDSSIQPSKIVNRWHRTA